MNELFNVTPPFDPLLAQIAMYAGTLLLNCAIILLLTAALIRFVLKPGIARISARHCLVFGSICLILGIFCLIPQAVNMQSTAKTFKNIRS